MKKGFTEIMCVVDRSGSMFPLTNDVIGGFNKFLTDQQGQPGEARLTLVFFNNTFRVQCVGQDIKDVLPLTKRDYQPDGGTALIDACCQSIDMLGMRLSVTAEDQRPERVIVVIMTDGEENASKEFRLEQLQERVKLQQETYKWEFLFLGANIDAFAAGKSLGIAKHATLGFDATPQGVQNSCASISRAVSQARSGGKLTFGS